MQVAWTVQRFGAEHPHPKGCGLEAVSFVLRFKVDMGFSKKLHYSDANDIRSAPRGVVVWLRCAGNRESTAGKSLPCWRSLKIEYDVHCALRIILCVNAWFARYLPQIKTIPLTLL